MYKQANTASGATGCSPAFGRGGFNFAQRQHSGHWGGHRRPKYNVPVNIEETETSYEVSVYAIGFDKANISISVAEDLLYISGTRTIDEENKPNFSRQEFPIKSFERTLDLNGQVDTASISAKQENGVLIVTLPKTKDAQTPAHKIEVL